jgi:hypothetical protein
MWFLSVINQLWPTKLNMASTVTFFDSTTVKRAIMGVFIHTSWASCWNTSLLYFNCIVRTIQSVLLFPVLKCHMRDTHWNNVRYLCEKWFSKKSAFQDITIPNNELFIWIVNKLRLTGLLMDKSKMKKQDILWKTNCPLSSDKKRTTQKMMDPTTILLLHVYLLLQ